ncbi:aspartate aminotransferase family protein [Siminovitchia sediminis]|uniref:Aspartate aminotransferase family protein n=1 Tax=Siminovitchia sediminis TaxID=1274353 RepID=A0ABW4KIV8_9BACI
MERVKSYSEKDRKYHLHPTTPLKANFEQGPTVFMERGEGIYLYDFEGKKYIDGLASLWNVNIGHGRKEIAEVAKEQIEKLAYSHSFNRFSHDKVVQLAEKVASIAPGDLNVCQFTSGGSESNESAFKLVRHYFQLKGMPAKNKILSRYRGYHGVSLGATGATGIPAFRQMAGPPMVEGFIHAKAPYCYRCESCQPECNGECAIDSILNVIREEGPETIAAIIVEPIQGAGGVIVPPQGYMKKVREICNQYGLLMIADEVITGFGRTGKWFGMQREDVVPDIMTVAKGITSGYIPLGGVVISEKLHREMVDLSDQSKVFAHGFTYSGHPTACAVAMKNIEIMEEEKLPENAYNLEGFFREGLEAIKESSPIVGNVMSRGLIASLEFVQDKDSKKAFDPSAQVAQRVFESALKRGLITRAIAIDHTDIIAMCPPLNITKEQISDLLQILEDSVQEVSKKLSVEKV